MNVLKGLTLGILDFLPFLALSILGLGITLNYTILNPNFVIAELDKLDMSSLVEKFISEETAQEEFSEEFRVALVDTVAEFKP